MADIYKKMIEEALTAQRADVETIKNKRGTEFKISDAKPYVDAVNGMTAAEGQSQTVIDLHVNSVNAHYDILNGLTKTVRPEDDPFVEHYQTPPIMEILFDEDPSFRDSVDVFIEAIAENEALVGKESIRRYGGFYGPCCVVDFAFSPGSTSNVVNRILKGLKINDAHKQAILSSKSWGMDTSYGIGAAFQASLEAGNTAAQAVEDEIAMLQMVYDKPSDAQVKLMTDAGHTSFDTRKYMHQYKNRMKDTIKTAMDEGVHYGNIVTVPAYCVGDVAHHISQSMFNMCKDDVTMAIIEAETQVLENALKAGLAAGYKSPNAVLNLATGATAMGAAYILQKDSFTASMLIDLLTKRYTNFVQNNPTRGPAAELHNVDFMDMIQRGSNLLEVKPIGKGGYIGGVKVDLSPIDNNEVLANPQRYTYPACAITVRFSSLMRLADFPCLLTSEPVTATLMTNIIALHPEVPGSPARGCKGCATSDLVKTHQYCQWSESV
ncbi:MAG: DUF2193 domain-containing protein [Candidatus Methanoperedens sp.]|jgi:hypothetical protein|nr:DUF2193 domain-containing protein [Candidatus Methanoperedens sp.]PKL53778.1 MAG: DUF2193 domain-containing protein [Candidatus Methanoperedenaceae archaeon HGW-Methanoperedenaceae-1]